MFEYLAEQNYISITIDHSLEITHFFYTEDYPLFFLEVFVSYDIDILIGANTHILIGRPTHTIAMLMIIARCYYNNHCDIDISQYDPKVVITYSTINTVVTVIILCAYNYYIMELNGHAIYILMTYIHNFLWDFSIIIEMFMNNTYTMLKRSLRLFFRIIRRLIKIFIGL